MEATMNGNSACSMSNGNSFGHAGEGRDLPWWFRMAMPVPVTLVTGI